MFDDHATGSNGTDDTIGVASSKLPLDCIRSIVPTGVN